MRPRLHVEKYFAWCSIDTQFTPLDMYTAGVKGLYPSICIAAIHWDIAQKEKKSLCPTVIIAGRQPGAKEILTYGGPGLCHLVFSL